MPVLTLRAMPLVLALCGATALGAAIGITAASGATKSLGDYIASICAAHFDGASREEAPFLADNVNAMSKMMVDMGITPSGDIDHDFVAMMAPHHQGAVEMAQAELRYGRNERLRRIAQEIIVTRQQEIAAMRLAIGEVLPGSSAAPNQQTSIVDNAKSELR
jgi:hypothetical protein